MCLRSNAIISSSRVAELLGPGRIGQLRPSHRDQVELVTLKPPNERVQTSPPRFLAAIRSKKIEIETDATYGDR